MEPIIFAGTPETAATSLSGLLEAGYEVALVITREDAPAGRKRTLTPSPVATLAVEKGLPVLKTNRITEQDEAVIAESGARLAVVVAFGVLLKQSTINLLPVGWFNLHYSVLPRWRGASPVQSALANGDRSTGVTLFKIDSGLDTGDIVGIAETMIEENENASRLLVRLTHLGLSLLSQELPKLFAGIAKFVPQVGEPTFAPKTNRVMARILTTDTAEQVLRKVRAYNPEPMAWLEFNGLPLRVLDAIPASENVSAGEITAEANRVLFGFANDTALEVQAVQPAGKPVLKASDWFRGTKPTERRIS